MIDIDSIMLFFDSGIISYRISACKSYCLKLALDKITIFFKLHVGEKIIDLNFDMCHLTL